MRNTFMALLGAIVVVACGGGADHSEMDPSYGMHESKDMYVSAPVMEQAEGPMTVPAPPPPSPDGAGEPAQGAQQFIAYSHSLGLRLPVGGVEAMVNAHVEACRAAGTSTCIVINSNTYTYGDDDVRGSVSIRAVPDWINPFLDQMPKQAETAGGEIINRSTSAEDLTRTILDTDARLKAQVILKGRLEGLLENRDGDLSELLAVERELARVNGEVESITAQLRNLKARVSMSRLDVGYETRLPAFSGSGSNPLGEAFGEFFYNLSSAIAGVITAFAFGLPWLFLVGVLVWVWLRLIWPWVRGRRKGKLAVKTED